MIYYKITDKESKAYKRHSLYGRQYKEQREKLSNIIDEIGLPAEYYESRGSVIGFKAPENEESIPEGMHVNANDRLTPDKRTTKGKEIHKQLKGVKFPGAAQYMKNLFGSTASVITSASRMVTGCSCQVKEDTVLVKVNPEVLKAAKGKEEFNIPDGLEEIPGSEYHDLVA